MTNKEAIAILERLQEPEAWEPQISEDAYTALEMAIEAFKKQIPQKPVDTDVDDRMGKCPLCGSPVMWSRSVYYRRRYGQAIDWGMGDGNKTE